MNAKCPYCGNETGITDNPFRPFCSERCKLIDLGRWLSGVYRVPIANEDEDDAGESPDRKHPVQE
jgi:endogenous inhibitor of DNA gyrase (YacG/DUF329 family)